LSKKVNTKQIKVSNENNAIYLLIALPILFIALAFSTKTVDVVLMPKYLLFALSSIIIFIFSYLNSLKQNLSFNKVSQHLYFRFYLIYIILAFISLQFSCNFLDGIFEWLKIFLFGSFVFAAAVLFYHQKKNVEFFVKAVTITNLFIVIIGTIQFAILFSKHQITHNSTYEVTATFGHKNIFAELLFLTFPFTLYNLFYSAKFWKYISVIGATLSLFLIVFSLTRAVWLSTIVGFLVAFPFYLFAKKSTLNFKSILIINKRNAMYAVGLMLVIIASIFIYARFDSLSTLKKQVVSIVYFRYGSGAERLELWKKSISVFKENPIIGNGLGSWKIKVLNYGHKGLETEDNKTFHQRPHNDFIWILAEQGIVGLLCYLILVSIVISSIIKRITKSQNHQEKFFFFLCLYTYFGYLIFSFFSFPKERIEHQVILAIMFAIIIISDSNEVETQKKGWKNHAVFLPLIVISFFAFFVGYKRYAGEIHLQKAYTARANSEWQIVISEIEKAESKYFAIDPMCTPLRWYSGSAYYNMGNQQMAYADFQTSYKLNPNHIHVLNNLGTAYEINGEHDKAIKMYSRALEISPAFNEAQLNLVASYFNSGNKNEAFKSYSMLSYDTLNEKYIQILPLVVNAKLKIISDTITCIPLKMQVEAIYNTPDWSKSLFVKSIQNKVSFDKQILTDAIFVLDSVEKKNNFVYINSIINKFKIVEYKK